MLTPLITLYRTAQFTAHNAHHLTKGLTFFEDHEFFGELYSTYESAYDSLVERAIGTGESVNLVEINQTASLETTKDISFDSFLTIEGEFCRWIDINSHLYSQGTQNLLAQLADDSEVRQYKIKQRMM